MSRYKELKEATWRANLELPKSHLVMHTFGNASACDRGAGVFAIKPSGMPFERLTPDDMVVVDLDCRPVEGTLRPSSDTKTHAVLYRAWPHVGGVVHTHSPHAVAWAQAMRPIPPLGTTHADSLAQDIPCTPMMSDEQIRGDYEESTGELIVQTIQALHPAEAEMVLVACHGPFTWGKTADRAVENSITLEMIARIAYMTLQIDPKTPSLNHTLLRKHNERKHGPNAYYGQR
jgi:L-ribulose-5-phosphate 4-epimerase